MDSYLKECVMLILLFWIRVLLGFIRVYFSEGDLRGRNVPQEERGKRKGVLGGRRMS